jgi:acetyl-CoA C-acetyltransferase
MGAALVLCSAEAARRHGVPEDRFVYLHAATDVLRTEPMAERAQLHDEPALGAAGRRALELAGCAADDVEHVDLYSCFPSSVQIAAAELGFDLERELSVTGGLTFSGGPFNSYVMHSLSKLVERLRADPDALGFASGVGGYMAKHAFGVYGAAPPRAGFRYEDCTEAVRPIPTRPFGLDLDGPAVVESFAQIQAPQTGEPTVLAACLREDGHRTFATNADPAVAAALAREELCGRAVQVRDGAWEPA